MPNVDRERSLIKGGEKFNSSIFKIIKTAAVVGQYQSTHTHMNIQCLHSLPHAHRHTYLVQTFPKQQIRLLSLSLSGPLCSQNERQGLL